MNASWFEHLADWALHLQPWPDERFPPSPYYRFLKLLAWHHKPRLSVELGVCGGGGSFHLAVGWPQGTVVGVEQEDSMRWRATQHERDNWAFVRGFCPNFVLWRGDSVDDAQAIAAAHGQADLLFIDTVHTYGQTMAEWAAWEPHLSERAVVVMDDLHRDGMGEAWEDVPWPNKARLDRLHDGSPGHGGGFGVAWR
jgi:predicted O-methyltransferase YrrM